MKAANNIKWATAAALVLTACNTSDPMPPPRLGSANADVNSASNVGTNNTAPNSSDPNNQQPSIEGDLELLEPTTAAVFTSGELTFRATSEGADRIVLMDGTTELGEFSSGALEFDATVLEEGVETVLGVVSVSAEGDEIGRAEVGVTLDQTAPSVSEMTPAENAQDSALRAPLVVTFSEPVADASVTAMNGGEAVEVEWETVEGALHIWVVEPEIVMPADITFEVESYADRAGNSGEPMSRTVSYQVWQQHTVGASRVDFATAVGFEDVLVTTTRSSTAVKVATQTGWRSIATFEGPEFPVAERIDAGSILVGGIAPNSSGSMAFKSWVVTGEDVIDGPSFAVGDAPAAAAVEMVSDGAGGVFVAVAANSGPIVMQYRGDSFGPHGNIGEVEGYRTDDIGLATDGESALVTFPVCAAESPSGCSSLQFHTYRLDGSATEVGSPLGGLTDGCTGRVGVTAAFSGTDYWVATWTSTCSQQDLRAYRMSNGRLIPTFDAQQQPNLGPVLSEIVASMELFGAGGVIALGTARPAGASVRLFNAAANGWTPELPVTVEAGESFSDRALARFTVDEWASPLAVVKHGGSVKTYRFNK